MSFPPTPQELHSRPASRRRFLKQTVALLGIGLGVTSLPDRAHALNNSCCPSTCRAPWTCDFPTQPYQCEGCGHDCCICVFHQPYECFQIPCPCG